MSLHKVTAGHGYTYLTRQVAAHDRAERGSSLASYYTEKGESPGWWLGSGLAGLSGLSSGDLATEAQMVNLFGYGRHPLADELRATAVAAGASPAEAERATRLGNPYRVFDDDIPTFRQRVAERMREVNEAAGLDQDAPGDPGVRARVRTDVAVELFRAEFGREPASEREIIGTIAKHSRPRTTAVAGFDLTFSPVKSVSTLWALAPPEVAAAIEKAHNSAVADALRFLENTALFTREGAGGVRQVETRGLIGAAFTHRDSRAGDPDLHTHVAVANKVQTRDGGKWLAIDGRVLFKANVAASETYNTALEHHLWRLLGLRFEARANPDARKRPVREVIGIDARVNERWSSRRAAITTRQAHLVKRFHADHGRPPTQVEAIALAQQATLETRDAKHEPRTLDQQRTAWAGEAAAVLGSPDAVHAMVSVALRQGWRPSPTVDTAWIQATAAHMHDALAARRAHWQIWHVHAEALRRVRGTDLDNPAMIERVADLLTDQVLTHHCVALTGDGDDMAPESIPAQLRRSDGTSVYSLTGSTVYTSPTILAAETRLLTHAGHHDGHRIEQTNVDLALLALTANGTTLNPGQARLVTAMATSGQRLQLAIAPAGSGKTTALTALAHAWTDTGGTLIALAPSAAAADVLHTTLNPTRGHSTNTQPTDPVATDTLAKLAWHITHPDLAPAPESVSSIGPSTMVVIDEAAMADTLTLDTVTTWAIARGASIRLIGDDQQLSPIGAGGILRDIATTHGALRLSELMRFTNPAEAAATLALRDGHLEAIGFYLDHHRLHIGDQDTLLDDILSTWAHDHHRGVDAIMLAPTRDLVATLNHRARTHRLTTPPGSTSVPADHGRSVRLADGNTASVGDLIITRSNDRRLRTSTHEWVKNGDRWTITDITPTGALTASHVRTGRAITLPAAYVTASVDLGYATTIHTAQGVTADTSHTLLTGAESRQLLYTAATRGRSENHLYLTVVGDGDPHTVIRPEHTHPATPTDLLETILTRDDAARSATTTARDASHPATLLAASTAQYLDSLHAAAQRHLDPDKLHALTTGAEKIVPGITTAPAWPTLHNHLVLAALDGHNPLTLLRAAATDRLLGDAGDPAALLDWRLTHNQPGNDKYPAPTDPSASMPLTTPGPLPWLPAIPAALNADPHWGPYLNTRAAAVRYATYALTETLHTDPNVALPEWARQGHSRPDADLLTDITIWRAAQDLDPADRRPTGPPLTHAPAATRTWQQSLDRRLNAGHSPAAAEWRPTFQQIFTHPSADPFTPVLSERLAAITRAGINTPALINTVLHDGRPLPDDHQAAALWWRLTPHLTPAVTTDAMTSPSHTEDWAQDLHQHLDAATAEALRTSSCWPALVAAIDTALARGETLQLILHALPDHDTDVDPAHGLLWRTSLRNNPPTPHEQHDMSFEHDPTGGEPNPFWNEPLPWAPTLEEHHRHTETTLDLEPAEADDPLEHDPAVLRLSS